MEAWLRDREEAGIEALAACLSTARSALFITGAGVSADSGLPTYRGVGGLYEATPVDEGVPIEVALSAGMFRRRPEVTWKYIRQIEASCRGAGPNEAHRVIAWLERRMERVVVLTQNVDGLHQAAGSREVIPIHGDVHALRCVRCPWNERVADYRDLAPVPACPDCGALVRPEVVLFDELLPVAAVRRLENELVRGFDVVVSVGTTSAFPYIARPVLEAAAAGVPTFEIDPGDTAVSHAVSFRIREGAARVLGEVGRRLGREAPGAAGGTGG